MNKIGAVLLLALTTSGCGTLTGIPGHGGGKRFSEEQRLVASSIRLSLNQIDVSPLRGKRIAIVFGLIADEGGGNIVGGRASVTAILTQGQIVVPASTSRSSVDIFQVANSATAQVTTVSNSSTSETASATSTGNATSNGTSEQTSTSTNTQTGTLSSGTTTSSESTSEGATSSTTVTTGDANQTSNNNGTTNTTGTNTGTNTTSTNSSETTAIAGSVNGTSSSITNSTDTSNTTASGTGSTNGTQNTSQSGTSEQAVVTGESIEQSGRQAQSQFGIEYEGLGEYQNLAVPKSDAAFLMSEVRNKLLLEGVAVTTPNDPGVDAMLYVSVPILGTNRQRTDFVVYNNEKLRAEAYIEMFALNRAGRVIMKRQSGNVETFYSEDYILWSGPYDTERSSSEGTGLIGASQ